MGPAARLGVPAWERLVPQTMEMQHFPPGTRKVLCAALEARVEDILGVPRFDADSFKSRLASACSPAQAAAA